MLNHLFKIIENGVSEMSSVDYLLAVNVPVYRSYSYAIDTTEVFQMTLTLK